MPIFRSVLPLVKLTRQIRLIANGPLMEAKNVIKKLSPRIVFISVPNSTVGRKIARKAVESKMAACGTVIPGAVSIYRWKDQVETSAEAILLLKTSKAHLRELHKLVKKYHPYELPEFVACSITEGSKPYLRWLKTNLQKPEKSAS